MVQCPAFKTAMIWNSLNNFAWGMMDSVFRLLFFALISAEKYSIYQHRDFFLLSASVPICQRHKGAKLRSEEQTVASVYGGNHISLCYQTRIFRINVALLSKTITKAQHIPVFWL
jgi:hypothetical protein